MNTNFITNINIYCIGKKLSNLVFVVLWNDTPINEYKGELAYNKVMKFNHLCDDPETRSSDAYYMADVWDWFLGQGEGNPKVLCMSFYFMSCILRLNVFFFNIMYVTYCVLLVYIY